MDKKTYFAQYGHLKSWLSNDEHVLESLQASMTDAHAPEIRDDPVQLSPTADAPYVIILEKIERLKAKILLEKDLLWRLKAEMIQLFASLPPERYDLMVSRYIACLKWDQIYEEKHLSKSAALCWHRESLRSLFLPENAVDIYTELAGLDSGE